jgi:hypothetical protein
MMPLPIGIAGRPNERGHPPLRSLLARRGAYSMIADASAAGRLPTFPVRLFGHVGDVYARVETAAGDDFTGIQAMRLAALVHEEPPESLPALLEASGVSDFAPTVLAVVGEFGRVWKFGTDRALREWVAANEPHLAPILLFEVAHEGEAIPAMERAAEIGGVRAALARWSERLLRARGMKESRP